MDYQKLYQILPKSYRKWTVNDMEFFLKFIGLANLYPKFKQLTVDGSCLDSLTQEDLKDQLGIKSTITIKKVMSWIKKGLQQYEAFLNSRMQVQTMPTTDQMASLTQKPKLNKISSHNQQVPHEIMKRSSYKSVPDEPIVNPLCLKAKPIPYYNAPFQTDSQKMQIQESSMLSEPEQDKKKQLELVIRQHDGPQTSFFSVKEDGAKIGRHSSNQILILDESISRFHAQIKFQNHIFTLKDTGSTTGTFIKLTEKTQIQNDMIIEMGSNQFQARIENGLLSLQVIQGSSIGYKIDIPNNKLVSIGRKNSNLLNFPDDQHLSNTHANIFPIGSDKFFVQDLGTTNGTWMRLSYQGQTSANYQLYDKTVFKIGSSQTYVCAIKTTFVSQKTNPSACIICYQNDKDCLYMPCKHNAACIRCSKNLKECPICRLKIQDFVRIYKN